MTGKVAHPVADRSTTTIAGQANISSLPTA
jgi:hypothetical protein